METIQSPIFETFVIEVKNWRVWGNQGAVITNDGYLFNDVSREFSEKTHSIYKQISLAPYPQIQKKSAVIATSGADVYFHWMLDLLPRVQLLKTANVFNQVEKFIINYNNKPFQKELLTKLGINESMLLLSNDHWKFHFEFEELYIPSLPSPNDCPSLESCLFLRELFKLNISNTYQNKRLYIQRTGTRVIENESHILPILKKFNFEIIHPEDLSVEKQAEIFSEAEIIIGAHGAGFTNIIFSKPNTYIIDIFSPQWINPCYWIISNHLNLNYNFLIGENILPNRKQEDKAANIYIDVTKFNKLLRVCLNHE